MGHEWYIVDPAKRRQVTYVHARVAAIAAGVVRILHTRIPETRAEALLYSMRVRVGAGYEQTVAE